MCRYYYEQGELYVYYAFVEQYALKAYGEYDSCTSELSDETQLMLEEEESEFYGNWWNYIRFDRQKIEELENFPSPNRPARSIILLKKYLSYLKNCDNSSIFRTK